MGGFDRIRGSFFFFFFSEKKEVGQPLLPDQPLLRYMTASHCCSQIYGKCLMVRRNATAFTKITILAHF